MKRFSIGFRVIRVFRGKSFRMLSENNNHSSALLQSRPPPGPPQGILQIPCEHRRRNGDDACSKGNEETYEKTRRPVVLVSKHKDEDHPYRHKTDEGYRATLDGAQRIDGHLREYPILPNVSEQPERPIERQEKRSGTHIHIRQEGIFEIDLEGGGMNIPALEVRFPK